jgi:DNA-binding transcriptional LysR family regulator
MELRHLRYFVAVAEELNFTRAAARLHTSQPSLSQQIRQLEAGVGVRLLERSRQHVALTSAGRIFLREAKEILGRVEHAGRLAKQAADGRAGDLSVGTFPAADVRILPALRPLLAAHLPDLRLILHSKYAVEPVAGLLAGTLDVAFVRGPIESDELQSRGHELITAPSAGFDFNQEISLYRKTSGVQRDSVCSIRSNNGELHEPSWFPIRHAADVASLCDGCASHTRKFIAWNSGVDNSLAQRVHSCSSAPFGGSWI